jgi:hypothetical protein
VSYGANSRSTYSPSISPCGNTSLGHRGAPSRDDVSEGVVIGSIDCGVTGLQFGS